MSEDGVVSSTGTGVGAVLKPMAVNQALCLKKKGEVHAFVIVPETGLALYPVPLYSD